MKNTEKIDENQENKTENLENNGSPLSNNVQQEITSFITRKINTAINDDFISVLDHTASKMNETMQSVFDIAVSKMTEMIKTITDKAIAKITEVTVNQRSIDFESQQSSDMNLDSTLVHKTTSANEVSAIKVDMIYLIFSELISVFFK